MLNTMQKNIASKMATELIEDGMIVAEELEWYIKTSTRGIFKFKNDAHYNKFEEEVLSNIENRRKYVKVLDLSTGEVKLFKRISEVEEHINIQKQRIITAISQSRFLMKRYKVEYVKMPLEDLIYKN